MIFLRYEIFLRINVASYVQTRPIYILSCFLELTVYITKQSETGLLNNDRTVLIDWAWFNVCTNTV